MSCFSRLNFLMMPNEPILTVASPVINPLIKLFWFEHCSFDHSQQFTETHWTTPQTSGTKAFEHLHPSHFRSAFWQDSSGENAIQTSYTSPETTLSGGSLLQPTHLWFKSGFRAERRQEPAPEAIIYLHSQRRALLFPLWGKWRWNFSAPSNEGSLKFALLRFFSPPLACKVTRKKCVASSPMFDKHRLKLLTYSDKHGTPVIFFYLFYSSL